MTTILSVIASVIAAALWASAALSSQWSARRYWLRGAALLGALVLLVACAPPLHAQVIRDAAGRRVGSVETRGDTRQVRDAAGRLRYTVTGDAVRDVAGRRVMTLDRQADAVVLRDPAGRRVGTYRDGAVRDAAGRATLRVGGGR